MKKLLLTTLALAGLSGLAMAAEQDQANVAPGVTQEKGAFNGWIYSCIQMGVNQNLDGYWGPGWSSSGYSNGGMATSFGINLNADTKGVHMAGNFNYSELFFNGVTPTGEQYPYVNQNSKGVEVAELYFWNDILPQEISFKLGLVGEGTFNKQDGNNFGIGNFNGYGASLVWTPQGQPFGVGVFYPVAYGKLLESYNTVNAADFYPVGDSVQEIGVAASYKIGTMFKVDAGTIGGGSASYSNAVTTAAQGDEEATIATTHGGRQYFGTLEFLGAGFTNTFFQVSYTDKIDGYGNRWQIGNVGSNATNNNVRFLLNGTYDNGPWELGFNSMVDYWLSWTDTTISVSNGGFWDWKVSLTPAYKTNFINTYCGLTLAENNQNVNYSSDQVYVEDDNLSPYLIVNPWVQFPDFSFITLGATDQFSFDLNIKNQWTIYIQMDLWTSF